MCMCMHSIKFNYRKINSQFTYTSAKSTIIINAPAIRYEVSTPNLSSRSTNLMRKKLQRIKPGEIKPFTSHLK